MVLAAVPTRPPTRPAMRPFIRDGSWLFLSLTLSPRRAVGCTAGLPGCVDLLRWLTDVCSGLGGVGAAVDVCGAEERGEDHGDCEVEHEGGYGGVHGIRAAESCGKVERIDGAFEAKRCCHGGSAGHAGGPADEERPRVKPACKDAE